MAASQAAGQEPCVQQFFAYHQKRNAAEGWDKAANDNAPLVFGTYRGKRVRLVSLTKAGRVGITERVLESGFTADGYARPSDVTQIMPTLYRARPDNCPAPKARAMPPLPKAPASNSAPDIMEWVARAARLVVADLMETTRKAAVIRARVVCYGMLWCEGRRSMAEVGRLLLKDHTTVRHSLINVGLMDPQLASDDRGWLSLIWAKCALPFEAVPQDVVERLGNYVAVTGGTVEPSARHELLKARVSNNKENIRCAA